MTAFQLITDLIEDPNNNGDYRLRLEGEELKILWGAIERDDNARKLLSQVWHHMNGYDIDGTKRQWLPANQPNPACEANWNKLCDAIGTYLDPEGI